jgi:hypothetical protein
LINFSLKTRPIWGGVRRGVQLRPQSVEYICASIEPKQGRSAQLIC